MRDDSKAPGLIRRLSALILNLLILLSTALMVVSMRSSLAAYGISAGHTLHHEITFLLMDSLVFFALALLALTLWAWTQQKLLGVTPWINTEFLLQGDSQRALVDLSILIVLLAILKPFFGAEVFYGLWHDPALPVQTIEPAMLPQSGWLSLPGALILVIGCVFAFIILIMITKTVRKETR